MTITLAEMKSKSKRDLRKNPRTPYQKKLTERFGKFYQVQKIGKTKKTTPKANFKRVMFQLKNLAARKALITRPTHKANFKKVMSQLKNNAARKAYDEKMKNPTSYTKVKLIGAPGNSSRDQPLVLKFSYGPVVETLTHITVKKHTYPKYPSVRKGRLGEVLSFEERRKRDEEASARNLKKKNEFLARGYTIEDWLFREDEVDKAINQDSEDWEQDEDWTREWGDLDIPEDAGEIDVWDE